MCKQRRLFHVEKMKTAANQRHVLPAAWTWWRRTEDSGPHWCQIPRSQQRCHHRKWRGGGQGSPGSSQGPQTFCVKPASLFIPWKNSFWQSHMLKTKNTANRTRKAYSTPQIGKRMTTERKKPKNKRHGNQLLPGLNCTATSDTAHNLV